MSEVSAQVLEDLTVHARRVLDTELKREVWSCKDGLAYTQKPRTIAFLSPYTNVTAEPGKVFKVGGLTGGALLAHDEPAAVPMAASNLYATGHISHVEDIVLVVNADADPTVARAIAAKEGKVKLGQAEARWAEKFIYPAINAIKGNMIPSAVQEEVLRMSLERLWEYPGVLGKKVFRLHALIIDNKGNMRIATSPEKGTVTPFKTLDNDLIASAAEVADFYRDELKSYGPSYTAPASDEKDVIVLNICSDSRCGPKEVVPPNYENVVFANAGALMPPYVEDNCDPFAVTIEQITARGKNICVLEEGHHACGAVAASVGVATSCSKGACGQEDCLTCHIKPIVAEAEELKGSKNSEELAPSVEEYMASESAANIVKLPCLKDAEKKGVKVSALATVYDFGNKGRPAEGLEVLKDGAYVPLAKQAANQSGCCCHKCDCDEPAA